MNSQWEKLEPYKYWRKADDLDLIVTMDKNAEWGWDAYRLHKQLTSVRKNFQNHRQAMYDAEQWALAQGRKP